MKEDLISVIVPCYNVSKYVSKCLDSIINQTYKNLEIILVEDCSKDNTLEILQKYVEKDKRIKLIKNPKNGGLSFSRNVGLKKATGDYIGFIDSDDYIDLNYYENLIKVAKQYNADISICDMMVVYDETGQQQYSRCFAGDSFDLINIVNTGLAASACNKLFKKDMIKKNYFAEGKLNEDIAVIIPALAKAERLAYARGSYYYYIQRQGSIQNSKFSDKRFDIFDGVELTLERIKNHRQYNELSQAIIYNQIIVLLIYVIPKERDIKRRKEILKKFNILSRKYSIRRNPYYWKFLDECGKKHNIYYRALFKLNCTGHYKLSNLLICIYDILKKNKGQSENVIEENIDINKVIEAAKKQSKLKEEKVKVSVVVPNYNYARFMYQRLYSILYQNYKLYEILILDDKSSDNSIEVIDKIVHSIKKYVSIKTIYNDTNSGSAFKQWQKGIENAKGDYIWIAEADDYCEKNLIKELIKPINKNENVIISYSDTAFIDGVGNILLKTIKPEIDIQHSGHWDKSYVNNGLDEINKYSFLNNTIANVSSCLIKNGNYKKELVEAGKYHQAGDWLFYMELMSLGDISYIDTPLNYYRMHGNNVSSTMNHKKHLDELNKLYHYYDKKFKFNKLQKRKISNRIKFLKKVWKIK